MPATMNRADALISLERLASECSREGWDGYGAEPVRPGTVAQAGRFLDALPKQFPVPAPGVEPDSFALDSISHARTHRTQNSPGPPPALRAGGRS